ncbi:MAG: molecular chaperone [Rhodanobacteraceae bacterium]|jgi:fimbrial chaperone protein|nr:molecular chaperone [Rhodanobacteraceae bacterium]
MRSKLAIRGLAAALSLACSPAGASGLQVAPIGLEFAPASPAQGLWLTNTGDKPLHAQTRVFHWTQANGKDELTATQAMLTSPPMLDLAPGGRQLVRVIRTGAAATVGEDAFRVLVDELPQPDPQRQASSVEYVLRYSIPVFVGGAPPVAGAAAASTLQASFERGSDGLALVVHNAGARHVQLSNVSLLGADGHEQLLSAGLLGYVLPGMTMRWPLPAPAGAFDAGVRLKARINGEAVEQTIAVSALPR